MTSKVTRENLLKVNYNYRGPLRVIENNMIVLHEPLGLGSDCYTKLQIVPLSFWNALFICFHASHIGGHLNAHRRHARLHLRFYWPGIFIYCAKCCKQCPRCALANQTHGISEVCYKFPVEAPFLVLHVDGYKAGVYTNFEGSVSYLIAADGMMSFACM